MNTTVKETSTELNVPTARPFYTRLAALGFALIALTGIITTGVTVIAGNAGGLAFELPILVIGLLIAGALMRFGTWAQVLAGLLSFLLLATVLPFSTYLLLHPEDASDFIPLVLLLVGSVLGFIGSIVGLIQRRRHISRASATPAESIALKAVLAAVALIAAMSLVLTAFARTTVSADDRSGASIVEQKNFRFSPDNLTVKAGQLVRVVVKNDDTTLHTFTLDEAGVNVSISPGTERLIEFQAPAPGTYQWYCIPHSQSNGSARTGMVGTLVSE